MQYFGRTVGLKAPYSILLDTTFVAALFQQRIIPVKERIDKVLQGSPTQPNKYFILDSAVKELSNIHHDLSIKKHEKAAVFEKALQWIQKECLLLQAPSEGETDDDHNLNAARLSTNAQDDLIGELKTSKTSFIVASQDEELLNLLRQMGTVPIVRLANNTVLLLENPSKLSQSRAKGAEKVKWRNSLPEAEKALVDLVKSETKHHRTIQQTQSRPTAKKAKGPNPLSCKRKSTSKDVDNPESSSKKRRKRAARNSVPSLAAL